MVIGIRLPKSSQFEDWKVKMSRFAELKEGLSYTLREEGLYFAVDKTKRVIREQWGGFTQRFFHEEKPDNSFFDVIFINGCDYSVPHPIRYRIDHQREQLQAAGIFTGFANAWDVTDDLLRHGRVFVIFRCPLTDTISQFIRKAKALNKRVIYDIDDLVIDTSYTDLIPYVAAMKPEDKVLYDDGVRRMGETLKLCDAAITTTEDLAAELRKYVPRVYVNRNTASELMLRYSDIAVRRRDVLPKLDPSRIDRHEHKQYQNACAREARRKQGEVRIGYFSGSITHNADFDLVLEALVRVLQDRSQVKLVIVGDLDLPEALVPFSDRIIATPFCEWKRLPMLIADCDINIAPLGDSIFNRAKSENKWVEASLVKVPTVASNVGAFKTMIDDGVTGLLCDNVPDAWYQTLVSLVDDSDKRLQIASAASSFCRKNCTTVGSCQNIAHIIQQEMTPNLAMFFPSLKTSGGVLVAFKHLAMLQDAGVDVLLVNTDDTTAWKTFEGHEFPVLNRRVPSGKMDDCQFRGTIDKGVATLWDTLDFLERYPRMKKKYYFVQNFETDFYLPGDALKLDANATYVAPDDVTYVTISRWCEGWLKSDFNRVVRFAPNGIDLASFPHVRRDFSSGKIRILIEGDCDSEYKNVDESFFITNTLDPEKYEIWYMSYTATTKPFYRIDRNLGSVPHSEIADVYRQCHILLKTSILESFSYPPLEMMATGGYVVAVPNGGNAEFLENEVNCLLYMQGDYRAGVEAIERIVDDAELRERLYKGGVDTAKDRDWHVLKKQIIALYE